jgi:ribosomal protein S18 acetylase RimI-like enzyme
VLREVEELDDMLLWQLEELENALFDNAFSSGTLRREFCSGARLWVIGEPDVIGYMLVREAPGITDILRLGVSPAHQAQGIGTLLLHAAAALFPYRMLCVKKENPGAIRLYKRHGFSIRGDLGPSWVMVTSAVVGTAPRTLGTEPRTAPESQC